MDGYRPIEFPSLGALLRGRLYLPSPSTSAPPVVVMAHGLSATVSGMTADRYAEAFAGAGLAVLLYDHRGFGVSEGEPRLRIDRWVQVIGYRDAIDHVTTLADVDGRRLAIWGDSLSGGEALVVAAYDRRVKALVAQVPACGRTSPADDPDGAIVARMEELYEHRELAPEPDVEGPLPVVSSNQLHEPSLLTPLTAFRWFIEYGGRFGTGWRNEATVTVPDARHPYQPVLAAGRIRVPSLFVLATDDEMPGSRTDVALTAYERLLGPKELRWARGGHFGLLHHPSDWFDTASGIQVEFLVRSLLRDQPD